MLFLILMTILQLFFESHTRRPNLEKERRWKSPTRIELLDGRLRPGVRALAAHRDRNERSNIAIYQELIKTLHLVQDKLCLVHDAVQLVLWVGELVV